MVASPKASVYPELEASPRPLHLVAPRTRPARYAYADYVCAVLGVCITFAISLRIGLGRLMWEDEVLGWLTLRDPSWRHVLYSWLHGADGGGALFYISGRV
jgi:hypothetical protein